MKQFNIEEYKKNPNRKVITRDGRSVRIVCTDVMGAIYPVLAVCKKDPTHESWNSYTTDRKLYTEGDTDCDLFFAPEKKEGWINVYRDEDKYKLGATYFYPSEQKAKANIAVMGGLYKYVATVKIEWEE